MSGVGEVWVTPEVLAQLTVSYEDWLTMVDETYGLRLSRFTRELLAAGLRGQRSVVGPAEHRHTRLYWDTAQQRYVIQRRDYLTPWPELPEGADLLTLW